MRSFRRDQSRCTIRKLCYDQRRVCFVSAARNRVLMAGTQELPNGANLGRWGCHSQCLRQAYRSTGARRVDRVCEAAEFLGQIQTVGVDASGTNNPPKTGTPAPNNGEPPSACLIANINAVNAVSNLNVNLSNVVGQPFIFNGGLDVNFSVPGASPSQLPAGRYASSVLTKILGIGHSLHVPGPGGADRQHMALILPRATSLSRPI